MKNHLILGDWNALCDSCGRKFKASSLQKRWDGLIVCKEDWEQRHPQDLLRVQREQISVPWSRPYPAEDTYLPWYYTDTENDALGSTEGLVVNFTKIIRDVYLNSKAVNDNTFNLYALNDSSTTSPTETFTFTETFLAALARFLTDNLSLTETVAKAFTKTISETVSVAESLYFAETEAAADSLSLTESRAFSVLKILSDSLSITESTTYKLSSSTAVNGAALDTKLLG